MDKNDTQAVLDAIEANIAILDKNGTIIMTNKQWDIFAKDNNAVLSEVGVGNNYFSVCEEMDSSQGCQAIAGIKSLIREDKLKFTFEYPCHSPKQKRWFKMYASLLDTAEKNIIVIHQNITERKIFELELKEKFFEHQILLNNLTDQIWYLKDRDTYGVVNYAHAKFFGLSVDDMENKKISEVIKDDNLVSDNSRVYQDKNKIKIREWITNHQGEQRLLEVTKTPKFVNGEIKYIVCVAKDITAQELGRQKIKRQNELRKIINQLSSHFINLPFYEIERGLKEALEKLGKFTKVDRCYCCLKDLKFAKKECNYEWRAEGVGPAKKESDSTLTDNYFKLMTELNQFRVVQTSDIKQNPDLKEDLKDTKINSLMLIPIVYDKELAGIIVFETIKQRRDWSNDLVSLYKLIGDLFADIIKRGNTEQKLAEYTAEVEQTNMQLEYISNKLQEKIEKAEQLHEQFLPKNFPEVEGLEFAAFYQPAENIGGDFYNIIRIKDKIIIYLVDITGHGLDGAMLNIFVRESINNFLLAELERNNQLSPAKIINFIYHKYCQENFRKDYFICLALGILDLNSMEFKFSNAGMQIMPIVTNTQGELSRLEAKGLPLSTTIDEELYAPENLESITYNLKHGDSILFTTDGLIEEEVANKIYGEERLKKIMANSHTVSSNELIRRIKDSFSSFSGDLQGKDDITLFLVKRNYRAKSEMVKRIKSDIEVVYQLKDELDNFIKRYVNDPDEVFIAFNELVINAIEHGNQFIKDKEVLIEVKITEEFLLITVTDQGDGFDWSNKIKPDFNIEMLEGERGRGVMMAKEFSDNLWYNEAGNKVYLQFMLD